MRPHHVAVTVAVLALVAVACSDSATVRDQGSPAAVGAGGPETEAYLALCSVADAAAAEDLAAAEATFQDRVHETLHHLAEDVEGVDRAASAALLRAKSDVEADFVQEAPDAAAVQGHVGTLLETVRDALEVVGIAAPECPEARR